MAFEIGQRVGEYEVVSMLGVGGMGQVYQVRNVISNRTDAMKVLLPDLVAEADLAVRFNTEIRTLASLDHPNIARLHTAFQVDNQLVMIMEFVEGLTLEQRAKQGPILQSDIVSYLQQVLSALSYAHGRGVIHRDIKPANIMVTAQGVVKLMDFGIAKSSVEKDLTLPGTTMGSMYYMAPEQMRGGTVDARSDIYSVGIVMYELFAGRRPFEADSAYAILNQQCNVAPQPPVEVNPQLPGALSDLILSCLAKDPANRFQNAQAVSNALRHVAAAEQNTTPKIEGVPFTPVVIPVAAMAAARPASSHRGAWIAVGALAVLVVVASAAVGLPHLLHISAKPESAGEQAAQTSLVTPAPATPAPATPASPDVPSVSPAASHPADAQPSREAANTAQPAPVKSESTTSPLIKTSPGPHLPRPEYTGQAAAGSANEVEKQSETPASTADEAEQAHAQMTGLDARASAVSASVESLKRQQQADGTGLRQDMAATYARMNSYLRMANADLESGNITAARNHMDKADKEVSTLESFFGK